MAVKPSAAADSGGASCAVPWSARQYVQFEDERTRPVRDLLAAVPVIDAHSAIDIGCGPGNSTELLAVRFAGASVSGLDSSADMIAAARRRLPGLRFELDDVERWAYGSDAGPHAPAAGGTRSAEAVGVEAGGVEAGSVEAGGVEAGGVEAGGTQDDGATKGGIEKAAAENRGTVTDGGARFEAILANAVLQWVPDHARLFPALAAKLAPGGVLAVQMPDNLDEPAHRLMREVAAEGPWAAKLAAAGGARPSMFTADRYYEILSAAGCRVDIWRTTYYHALAGGAAAVVEWFKGSGLRPFIAPLDGREREEFLERYRSAVACAYPAKPDGGVLLPFPRLFIVAAR